MSTVKITVVNKTEESCGQNIVIFQKRDGATKAFAWLVIQNLSKGQCFKVKYTDALQVSTKDAYANFTIPRQAEAGDRFEMRPGNCGGTEFVKLDAGESSDTIEIENKLKRGACSAFLLRNDRTIDKKNVIVPGQKAVFKPFPPTLYFAIDTDKTITEESELPASFVEKAKYSFGIDGTSSLTIALKGGKNDTKATPYTFEAEKTLVE